MGESEVSAMFRRVLPSTIQVADTAGGLSPNEMRKLKKASGRRLDELFGEEADLDDKTQAIVWVQLLRAGFEPSWDEAGDVQPIAGSEAVDPTNAGRLPNSPPSVASGE